MLLKQYLDRPGLALRISCCALFVATAFALLPKGFRTFGALMLVCTLLVPQRFAMAWRQEAPTLRWTVGVCAAVIVLTITSMYLTGQEWRRIDNYARFLVVPWAALLVCALSPGRVWLWAGALSGVCIAFAVALWEDAAGVGRVGGWHNPIVFANAVLMLLVMVVYCRPEGTKPWIFVFVAAALVMGVVAIVLSGTRGALPGFGLMLLVAVVGGGGGSKRWLRAAILLAAMVVLLVLMWKIPWLASQTRLDAIQADLQRYLQGHVDSPIGARLEFLSLAWHAFLEHPLAGVGLDRFDSQIQALPECAYDQDFCRLGHAHNDIAHWAATLGLPGLLVILAIYLVPFLQFLKIVRSDARKSATGAAWAGMMLVLAFFLCGMTQSMFAHALSTMTYVVFVGLLLGLALCESTGVRAVQHDAESRR